jgi:hypothetical protein
MDAVRGDAARPDNAANPLVRPISAASIIR